ncbi:MAG: ester cyclase [Actinomycetota bacterium]|nr:ester cyclase [Actinomycetota bacterium]
MSDENKAVARRMVEELLVAGNFEIAEELVDQNYVGHDVASPEPIRGPEGLKQQVKGYRDAFPDLQLTIEDQVAEGDKVATRWTATGTHRGDLFGMSPTGKQTTVGGITIDRFTGGKIVESWDNWDALGLMQQLGAIPEMAQA